MMNSNETLYTTACTAFLIMTYLLNKNHVMSNLIMIEFILISIMMIMFIVIKMMNMENYLVLYIITISIVESMIGLSTLIAMIRTHGNDYLKSMMMMKL